MYALEPTFPHPDRPELGRPATVEVFQKSAQDWISTAQHPRFHHLYTECIYQPMVEAMQYLRANGFKTYIVTGGGQDFVRVYSERVYGIPREQVVGSTAGTTFGYKDGKTELTKEPRDVRVDDKEGKPIGIHLVIGRRPGDARIHPGRWWRTARDAGASR
jgi:hypothetical protein